MLLKWLKKLSDIFGYFCTNNLSSKTLQKYTNVVTLVAINLLPFYDVRRSTYPLLLRFFVFPKRKHILNYFVGEPKWRRRMIGKIIFN